MSTYLQRSTQSFIIDNTVSWKPKTVTYKGYQAEIFPDQESDMLIGRVMNTHDVLMVEAMTVPEVEAELHAAVDAYLIHCQEVGRTPDKHYSGKFALRFKDEDLHRRAATIAAIERQSLNSWINKVVREKLDQYQRQRPFPANNLPTHSHPSQVPPQRKR